MLTLQELKEMKPHEIIATGLTIDNYTGIYMSNSDKILRWVAVRGGIHDWAVYIHFATHDVDYVMRQGDKVIDKENIRRLVPCDDEAFKMYRY